MGKQPGSNDCSCTEARSHLEAFLDHECEETLSQRLAQHVENCEHCSRLADAERHLREILRSRCAEQAPASLRERVLGQLSAACGGRSYAQYTATRVESVSSDGTTVTRTTSITQSFEV